MSNEHSSFISLAATPPMEPDPGSIMPAGSSRHEASPQYAHRRPAKEADAGQTLRVLRLPVGQGAVRIELDEADAMRAEHIDGLEFDGMDLETLVFVPNARRILDPICERLALQCLLGVVERDRGGISDGHLLVSKGEAEVLHDVTALRPWAMHGQNKWHHAIMLGWLSNAGEFGTDRQMQINDSLEFGSMHAIGIGACGAQCKARSLLVFSGDEL